MDLFVIDVIALTKDDAPVLDLRPSDLILTIDGKRRSIDALQLVRLDEVGPPTSTAAFTEANGAARKDDSTLRPLARGRSLIFVFDQESMRPNDEMELKRATSAMIDRLSDQDRAAVFGLPLWTSGTSLTNDRNALRRALQPIRGTLPPPPADPIESLRRACLDNQRTGAAVQGLTEILESLRKEPGTKSVILFSAGFVPPPVTGEVPIRGCGVPYPDRQLFVSLGPAANAARAQLFVVQPSVFVTEAGGSRALPLFLGYESDYHRYLDAQLSGLETAAGGAGGTLLMVSGRADAALATAARASSAYYELGFALGAQEKDGKAHRISLKSNRRGVDLRTPPSFVVKP